jgi:hypothetical protein
MALTIAYVLSVGALIHRACNLSIHTTQALGAKCFLGLSALFAGWAFGINLHDYGTQRYVNQIWIYVIWALTVAAFIFIGDRTYERYFARNPRGGNGH